EVPGIELGTAVVPTYPRHPFVLAGQALTTSAALGGGNRLHLGIGLSHQLVIEGMFGMAFQKPAVHLREYLSALRPALEGQPVDVKGETLRATTLMGPIKVDDAGPVPILVAALGPALLRVAGELADGTLTWMAAPEVIGERIAPSITAAAEAAGRPRPRVGVGLPVAVTDDVDEALQRAASSFAIYGTLPSYKRLLDEAGLDGPAGVVIAGDEDEVARRIRALAALHSAPALALLHVLLVLGLGGLVAEEGLVDGLALVVEHEPHRLAGMHGDRRRDIGDVVHLDVDGAGGGGGATRAAAAHAG